MSEQRKRLSDAERERDWTTVNKYIPNHTPPCEAVARLVADGDQAREDRKRLAAALRETSGWESPTGTDRCWCHDGPCFGSGNLSEATDETCRRLSALLAEVGE